MSERESWATRAGFILAAVGSAVGLGNIWQFPFQTGRNGGAAFLVVYLLAVGLIGFPAMLSEFVIGRRSGRNPIDAFHRLGNKSWAAIGALGTLTAFWILSFYSVVGGWVMRYIAGSVTGAYFSAPQEYFMSIAAGPEAIAFHALFMVLTVGVVALGINDGIEAATKIMVPSIVIILLGLGAWAATLPGAGAGYAYYLSPDTSTLLANLPKVAPAAMGQAFFTLSLGMGAMITYSSYLDDDDSLPADGATIVVLNTLVGVMAGFVVFPILFSQGIEPGSGGSGAVFITLASAFADLPFGKLLGLAFFVVLLLAALSSSISLLEVMVSYITDHYDIERKPASFGIGLALFLLGVPTALSISTLTFYNDLAYKLLLPVSVLGILLYVGWVNHRDATDELRKGTSAQSTFATSWLWSIRTVVTFAVGVTLVLGVFQLAGVDPGAALQAVTSVLGV
jgi:NSS family neurotransmitter:Na+ symporter